MKRLECGIRTIPLCILLSAGPAFAENDELNKQNKSPFGAEISIGAEYDSNLSVIDVDTNTGADDVSAVLDAEFDFETDIAKDTEFSMGYSFSQSLHAEFTDFDIQSHFVSAGLSHDFGDLEIGGDYRFIYTRLGGDGFLTLQQASPYLAKFFGRQAYVRVDYTYSDKNFEGRVDRDSTVHAGGADFYFFINGVRTFLVAGYRYEDENAVDSQFDFTAHNLKARFSQRIPIGQRAAKLKLGWRYENRDYSSLTPSISAVRTDDRHRLQAELEVPLSDVLFSLVQYEYADFSSNLPSADYTQSVASLRLGARF